MTSAPIKFSDKFSGRLHRRRRRGTRKRANKSCALRMMKLRELLVNRKKCIFIDPSTSEKTFNVHWLPMNVPDEAVAQAFSSYGRVKKVLREKWRRLGSEKIEATTRTITIELKEENRVDSIAPQVTVMGGSTLVSILGRPPSCFRCRKVGHLRKQCRTPWCKVCRTFGHEEDDCVQCYSSRTRTAVQKDGLSRTWTRAT